MSAAVENESPEASVGAPADVGQTCRGCHRPLPLRVKQAGETLAHWECAACRTPVTGIVLKDVVSQAAEAVRLSQLHFDIKGVPRLSASLRQIVREFVACRKDGSVDERRALQRIPTLLDLTVVPVDQNWSRAGKPILGLMIDVTANGLGMVTPIPVDAEQVAVQIHHPTELVQLLGEVAWTKDFGPGFYNAGVHFQMRLGRAAEK